ncbi:hypothetical protein RB195_006737 [Necator americanus]|uniref:SXP/RAL-2 family protein Ani s 5-like cation-binding domain-containing protein n=1 Tax=Necator americanus TaxID=51031 RepID=A0ABR1BU00_NECAM
MLRSSVKIVALLHLFEFVPTRSAPNNFSVGGRARAPSSFWTAGTQQQNSDTVEPQPRAVNSPEVNKPGGAPLDDSPTNGFWPDPQALREFRRRLKDAKSVAVGPDNNKIQKLDQNTFPTVFIHHADRLENPTSPPAPPVTCAPQVQNPWGVIPPNQEPNPDNTLVVQPPAVSSPPSVPLEVLVHWIYDEENGGDVVAPLGGSTNQILPPAPLPPPPPQPIDRPPFLLEATDDTVAEYFKIIMDERLTKRELKCALEAWKATLTPYLLSKYEESEAERQRMFAVERDLRAQRVARLSPAAKLIADKIEAVRLNDEFTVLEEEHMIREIMQSAPLEIREELTAQ